jgi:hypothetical protein
MKSECCKGEGGGMMGWHGHGHPHPPGPPMHMMRGGCVFIFGILYGMVALKLTLKIAKSLDILATAKAIDQLGDRMTDVERTLLEERIRKNLLCCKA